MNFANRYLDAELVEQLKHLQLAARSVVEGTAAGLHRSQLKGASVEFRQHRAYVAGDEPRRLDWRVLARTNRPFVKEYDEETNLRCLMMLDCSGSMTYGDAGNRKSDYAGRVVAALSYLMLASTESVGLATVTAKLGANLQGKPREKPDRKLEGELAGYLAPRGGSLQLSRVIDSLARIQPAGPTAIAAAAQQVASRLGRRALLVLISDFFSPTLQLRDALARLRHKRHELICLRILHPDEQSFPFGRWSLFQGLEGEQAYLCEPALVRKKYLANFERHARELTTLCRSMSADLHVMTTGRPVIESIRQFLKSRSQAEVIHSRGASPIGR